jgi:DNA-binding transcriptional LysR family regulator
LTAASDPGAVEAAWVEKLTKGAIPAFVTNLTVGLLEVSRAGTGIAVLPRYLGDGDTSLVRLPMPDEPRETIWITVHRDLTATRRVRVILDFLAQRIRADRDLLLGNHEA